MKQTSVKWLEEELKDKLGTIVINKNWELMESLFEQAKQMEKEQIVEAYNKGVCNEDITVGEYYNETFKSK